MAGVGVGRPNRVLANLRRGAVQWHPLHPEWPASAMDYEDNHPQVCLTDILFIHLGLGRLLHRKQPQRRRYPHIHEGWVRRI